MNFIEKIKGFFENTPDEVKAKKIAKHITDYKKFKSVYATDGEKIAIIPWNSDEGKRLMMESHYINSFFSLAHNYQTQINPFYSSIASVVTVLNALRLEKGIVPDDNEEKFTLFDRTTGEIKEYSFNIYTQQNLLDETTDKLIKSRSEILPKIKNEIGYVDFSKFRPGLNLMQVAEVLKLYKCKAEIYFATDDFENGVMNFISHVKECVDSDKKFMIVNFYGEVIGLPQAGHFSTIGAYNGKKLGKALVLDSAAHKTPWYWVEIEQLYRAMNTISLEGNKRGYIVVEDVF
jgi:hypothetical protein